MKSTFFKLFILLVLPLWSFSQKKTTKDSLSIQFLFTDSIVQDSSQFTLKVIYKNMTNREVEVYEILEEGLRQDRFTNIDIIMEKEGNGKFQPHVLYFYSRAFEFSMEDSLRHYDLPKNKLAPNASDTLDLNLLQLAKVFHPGKYKFQAHLRVKTIRDNRKYNDPNFQTAPPQDTLIYLTSKWFYFTVSRYIQVEIKRASDDEPEN